MISTLLLSGGVGSRSGKTIPKQYCELLGKEIITYCIDSIVEAELTDELIIVYGEGWRYHLELLLKEYVSIFKRIELVPGGKTRQESVFNGLSRARGDRVILHEAARPLIKSSELVALSKSESKAATMGLSIPFTVLEKSGNRISRILKREDLFNVQLPQVFPRKELLEAHNMAIEDARLYTDDSSLYFTYIGEVEVVDGSSENIKITDSKDFAIAESILRRRNGN